jgi:hypothetical protein
MAERVGFVHLRGFAATADLIVSVSQPSAFWRVRSLALPENYPFISGCGDDGRPDVTARGRVIALFREHER